MGKYFGTDGFRGEAGITLTADHAYKVGRFLGWYYNALRERNGDTDPARIVIGKDTRRSSYMFEYSLVAGLTASGADAYLLHVTTTPSVAYIARVDDFDCGIMISASHNPYYDNGIKLIDCYGEKMPEETLLLVEDYIDGKLHVFDKDWPELPFAHREHIGCTVDYVAGRNRYMGYLISLGIYSFKGVKVGLDCANGSSWNIAKSVFDALGADTYVINNKPNGLNINNNAGSTHIEGLQKFVVEKGLDVGFAYDGDADRCLAVDELGREVDGDHIMAICADTLVAQNKLRGGGFVATVMSNIGLHKYCEAEGLRLLTTLDEKTALLEELGVDNVIVIPFDRAFSALSGEEFADDYLIGKVGAETLVAGYNHRFGHDRLDCDALAATRRLRVVKVGPCTVDGVRVSSTLIRRLLEEGKTEEAARLRGARLKS